MLKEASFLKEAPSQGCYAKGFPNSAERCAWGYIAIHIWRHVPPPIPTRHDSTALLTLYTMRGHQVRHMHHAPCMHGASKCMMRGAKHVRSVRSGTKASPQRQGRNIPNNEQNCSHVWSTMQCEVLTTVAGTKAPLNLSARIVQSPRARWPHGTHGTTQARRALQLCSATRSKCNSVSQSVMRSPPWLPQRPLPSDQIRRPCGGSGAARRKEGLS